MTTAQFADLLKTDRTEAINVLSQAILDSYGDIEDFAESWKEMNNGVSPVDWKPLYTLSDENLVEYYRETVGDDECPHNNLMSYTEDNVRYIACRDCKEINPDEIVWA